MSNIFRSAYFSMATAAIATIAATESALAFTLGQYSSNDYAINLQGQSFTSNQIGPNGTGTPPISGPVFLNSFTLSYPGTPSAGTLYIYSSLPAIADGTTALSTSTSFTDLNLDPTFGTYSRTFFFPGVQLEASQKYFALLPQNENLNYQFGPSAYSGGAFVFNTLTETLSGSDLAFSATLVPFEVSPVAGLSILGALAVAKRLKRVKKS